MLAITLHINYLGDCERFEAAPASPPQSPWSQINVCPNHISPGSLTHRDRTEIAIAPVGRSVATVDNAMSDL